MMSRASARAIKDWHDRAPRPMASTPPHDVSIERIEDATRELFKNPTTGRNTKLGKKVEKPRDPKSGGPSGQKDRARHDKRHANK